MGGNDAKPGNAICGGFTMRRFIGAELLGVELDEDVGAGGAPMNERGIICPPCITETPVEDTRYIVKPPGSGWPGETTICEPLCSCRVAVRFIPAPMMETI